MATRLATFDLTARVPANHMAVSNMPAASSRAIAGGFKEVRFQTTPIMSSYLLFFAAGDFERIAKKAAGALADCTGCCLISRSVS